MAGLERVRPFSEVFRSSTVGGSLLPIRNSWTVRSAASYLLQLSCQLSRKLQAEAMSTPNGTTHFLISICLVAVATSAFAVAPLPYSRGEVLFEDRFDTMDNWVAEQQPGGTVEIKSGKLEIDDVAGCTIWFKHRMEGPVMIEYDVHMIKAGGANDNTRDLNCFWMAIDPNYPTDIFRSTSRTGQFTTYDYLRLYYVGYGGHFNTKTRFRKYNGLGEKPLLPQHDLSRKEFMLPPNQTMKIQIVVLGNRTQYIRDGEVIFDFYDPEPYSEGWFAFRTVKNHMTADNFKVTRLIPGAGVDINPPLMHTGAYDEGYSIRQVSTGRSPSVHAYMDICPESPDGKHITYFEFEDKIPGWGHVIVVDRNSGESRYVSDRVLGHSHDGTRQQWLDNDHLIFGVEDEEESIIVNINDKTSSRVKGSIGMVSEINRNGLTHNNYPISKYGKDHKPSEMMIMDLAEGTTQTLLNEVEMISMHPRRDIITDPKWKGMGVFKLPKWSPEGDKLFWVYMLEIKGTNTKLVKSALLADSDGGNIRYVSEIGQHSMWSDNDHLLSYIRKPGFDHGENPTAQDVMIHPTNGEENYPLIPNALGIHGSLNPHGTLFVTDIHDWPQKGRHAVLLYDVASGDYRVLARMRAAKDDPENNLHPHPSWSRDGKGIYFNSTDTGESRVYFIDLSKFEFRPVARRG